MTMTLFKTAINTSIAMWRLLGMAKIDYISEKLQEDSPFPEIWLEPKSLDDAEEELTEPIEDDFFDRELNFLILELPEGKEEYTTDEISALIAAENAKPASFRYSLEFSRQHHDKMFLGDTRTIVSLGTVSQNGDNQSPCFEYDCRFGTILRAVWRENTWNRRRDRFLIVINS